MADTQPTTSRRGLLKALAVSAPAAAMLVFPTSAAGSVDRASFEANVALYRQAHAEFGWAADSGLSDDVANAYCDAKEEAFDRLLNHPAPDVRAIEQKMVILLDEYEDSVFEVELLDGILADIRRLAVSA